DADNFFVATIGADAQTVRYRFLVDGGKELEPMDRAKEGTLAGASIDHGRTILLREVERDRRRQGLPELTCSGAIEEHSVILAPLRQRGLVIRASRARGRRTASGDPGDVTNP